MLVIEVVLILILLSNWKSINFNHNSSLWIGNLLIQKIWYTITLIVTLIVMEATNLIDKKRFNKNAFNLIDKETANTANKKALNTTNRRAKYLTTYLKAISMITLYLKPWYILYKLPSSEQHFNSIIHKSHLNQKELWFLIHLL